MYRPPFTVLQDEDELRALVAAERAGWLVTATGGAAPTATLLPILWREATVIAHLARANPQWRDLTPGTPALIIVAGPQAYVSPSWYPSKGDGGTVVPTWNYQAVHLTGTITVHTDPHWLRATVTDLTDTHEGDRPDRWHVSDAPAEYVERQLRGIVGLEMTVTGVEGKTKLSQNRTHADQAGVADGLRDDCDSGHLTGPAAAQAADIAQAMTRQLNDPAGHPTPNQP